MIQLKRAYSKLRAYFWNYSLILSNFVQSTIWNTKNSKTTVWPRQQGRGLLIYMWSGPSYQCLIHLCPETGLASIYMQLLQQHSYHIGHWPTQLLNHQHFGRYMDSASALSRWIFRNISASGILSSQHQFYPYHNNWTKLHMTIIFLKRMITKITIW